jgi:CheY-like chemotaxis protein
MKMRKRVLVVDNEAYIQEVAKLSLEIVAGWQVLTAMSGLEAIEIAMVELPDVILLDVMMPGMDGLTTFAKLQEKAETQVIPVILLTASIQSSDRQAYKKLGIIHAIAKPFDPISLAQEITTALGW